MKIQSTLTARIREMFKDREGATVNRSIGTIVVILSGLILYADKLINYFNLQVAYEFKYYKSLEVFVWTMGNTISPILLIIGYWLRPHKWALAAPLTAFCVQLSYIFRDVGWIQRDYFWHHTIAFVVGIYVLAVLIRDVSRRKSKLVRIIHYLLRSIYGLLDDGFIKQDRELDYRKKRTEIVDQVVEVENE